MSSHIPEFYTILEEHFANGIYVDTTQDMDCFILYFDKQKGND